MYDPVVGLHVKTVPIICPGVVKLVLFNINDGVVLLLTCILRSLAAVL